MNRYKINKIGFLNFWLYDEEEFYFYDGKLLLRGTNGSGKSVTMQSFVPLIFDGNKNPERLDSFGSRARKIEDYLLMDSFTGNENTGYLYMEFFNKEKNHYITIGIGLRAIRNRNVEFWGFSLKNIRIGKDIYLYKDRSSKIPLTKRELTARIASDGEVVDNQKDYKKMVNRLLFGFPNLDLYAEFINLLLQIRSPKLSNSCKPTDLSEILSSVLEPLDETDIRVMSDSIESMNKYKEKIETLQYEFKAMKELKVSYAEYNKIVLYTKTNHYLTEKTSLEDLLQHEKEQKDGLKILEEEQNQFETLWNQNKLDQNKYADRRKNMSNTELEKINADYEEISKKEIEEEKHQKSKEEELNRKQEIERENNQKIKKYQDFVFQIEKEMKETLKNIKELEEEVNLKELTNFSDTILKEKNQFQQFASWKKTITQYKMQWQQFLIELEALEKLNQEFNLNQIYYEKNEEKIKKINQEKQELQEKIQQAIEDYQEQILKYNEQTKELKLSFEDKNRIMNDFEIIPNQIEEIIKNRKYIIKEKYLEEQNQIKLQMHELEKEKKLCLEEITNIKSGKEKIEKEILKERLKNLNIPFKRLYEVIDFKKNISEELKRNIEASLNDLGILSSLILPPDKYSHLPKELEGKYLIPGEKYQKNVSIYFDILPNDILSEKEILDILESIGTEEKNFYIKENGTYKFSAINGFIDHNYCLRFIGLESQKKYQENLLLPLENKITSIEFEQKAEEIKNQAIIDKINVLENETKSFPKNDLIKKIKNDILSNEIKENALLEQRTETYETISKLNTEMNKQKTIITELKKNLDGNLSGSEIKNRLKSLEEYYEIVIELEGKHQSLISQQEMLDSYLNRLEEIEIDKNTILLDLKDLNYNIECIKNQLKNLDDLLNSKEYKSMKEELLFINQKLIDLPKEEKEYIEKIAVIKTKIDFMKKELNDNIEEMQKKEILVAVEKHIMEEEFNLKYVYQTEWEEKLFTQIKQECKPSKNITMNDIYSRFSDSANKVSGILTNYAPKNRVILNPKENAYLDFSENYEIEIMNQLNEAKRYDLLFSYQGKNVNLLDLSNLIENDLTLYSKLLNEKDRELFEDLLINNVGSSIRHKIHESDEWIKSVKDLLESMNTSSGLSFSISWKGKEGNVEEELDTLEIVNIFKRDPKALKEEDLNKLTKHFRSKIKHKEEGLEEKDCNFYNIISDILDYRQWFQFKLYFKRVNCDKKELTDKEFSKFSGGEKALAMYIPLFCSIFAKYKIASPTSPHIIALDEAFAGVDDDNIKDCFRILKQLDLDYIMTSQSLWGDYETVPHLAIAELYHPIESDVVNVIAYKWDGHERSLVSDESDMEE